MYGYSLSDSELTAITDQVTNTVEGYHRQLRKVTKTKGAFSSDIALQKLVYLVIQNLQINRDGGPLGNDDLQLEGNH